MFRWCGINWQNKTIMVDFRLALSPGRSFRDHLMSFLSADMYGDVNWEPQKRSPFTGDPLWNLYKQITLNARSKTKCTASMSSTITCSAPNLLPSIQRRKSCSFTSLNSNTIYFMWLCDLRLGASPSFPAWWQQDIDLWKPIWTPNVQVTYRLYIMKSILVRQECYRKYTSESGSRGVECFRSPSIVALHLLDCMLEQPDWITPSTTLTGDSNTLHRVRELLSASKMP